MIAQTRVETIGRCLPPESGKFCTLFLNSVQFFGYVSKRNAVKVLHVMAEILMR